MQQLSLLALAISSTASALTCTKAPAVAYPIGVSISLQANDFSSCTDKDRTNIGMAFSDELTHLLRNTSSLGDFEIDLAICTTDDKQGEHRSLRSKRQGGGRALQVQGYAYHGSGYCVSCGEDDGDRRLLDNNGGTVDDEPVLEDKKMIDLEDALSDRLTEQVQNVVSCLDGQDPIVLVTATNATSFDENECGDV